MPEDQCWAVMCNRMEMKMASLSALPLIVARGLSHCKLALNCGKLMCQYVTLSMLHLISWNYL